MQEHADGIIGIGSGGPKKVATGGGIDFFRRVAEKSAAEELVEVGLIGILVGRIGIADDIAADSVSLTVGSNNGSQEKRAP